MNLINKLAAKVAKQKASAEERLAGLRADFIQAAYYESSGEDASDLSRAVEDAISEGAVSSAEIAEIQQAASKRYELECRVAKERELQKARQETEQDFVSMTKRHREEREALSTKRHLAKTAYASCQESKQRLQDLAGEFPELFAF